MQMKRIQRIDFYREIRKSLNRFLSILFIVTLGVAFFTGVRSSEPDMRLSADAYLDENHFFDIRILGSFGLTGDDIAGITELEGVLHAEGAYQTEAITKVSNYDAVLTVYSMCSSLNDVTLEGGRLPENDTECFLDSAMINSGDYKLGDLITLTSGKEADNILSHDTYTIVGYGSYAGYLTWDRGTASIGNGNADAFLFLLPECFVLEAYSAVYVTVEGAADEICYSDAYEAKVDRVIEEIKAIAKERCSIRYQEIYNEGYEAITNAQQGNDKSEQSFAGALDALQSIEEPVWYVLDRNSIQTYVEFGQDAERIGAIGKVFPIIFFLVAALVSLTTMTRMVEEQRVQIGTLKALGYGKGSIAAKYILYAFYASMAGGMLGVVLGKSVLPYVIIKAYAILYINITDIKTPVNWPIAVSAMGIAAFCVVAATFAASFGELASSPAKLMRPPAPPSGKRVLLERVTFLWKRLNFTRKATIRNLFRYKKRFFMTVFGIGSCMALLLVGFGLRDSIKDIINNQYRTLWTYDLYLSIEENSDDMTDLLLNTGDVNECMYARLTAMDASANQATKTINLFVPETLDSFSDFVVLKDRTSKETYELTNDGVVITEKLAKMLSLKVGDILTIKPSETEEISVYVTAITENYLFHYVYMSSDYYEQVFHSKPVYNRINVKTADMDKTEKEALGSLLLADSRVQSVIFVADMEKQISDMMASLDLVVWVLIISAGLLAFIVLYNLNNINIVERKRELATLKVLGFYNKEVAEYMFRENTMLTIFGIAVGVGMGIILHQFVIRTSEIDMIMFGRQIKGLSYLFSVLMTLLFSAFVNWVMYFRLKKIDMIESLKSVE